MIFPCPVFIGVNTAMKYIVFGVGRTGSLLLTSILAPDDSPLPASRQIVGGVINGVARIEPSKELFDNTCKDFKNIVIHTHYIDTIVDRLNIDPSEWNLIISNRRNRFNQLMSYEMTAVTEEYHPYTDRPITPFTVNPEAFRTDYKSLSQWPQPKNNQWMAMSWKSKIQIDFEDLVSQEDMVQFVADKLGLEKPSHYNYELTQSSPRKYKDYVLNWEELYNVALEVDKEISNDRNN
jgi:LPS sulfotransferase NodH